DWSSDVCSSDHSSARRLKGGNHDGLWSAIPALDWTITQRRIGRRSLYSGDVRQLSRCSDSWTAIHIQHVEAGAGARRFLFSVETQSQSGSLPPGQRCNKGFRAIAGSCSRSRADPGGYGEIAEEFTSPQEAFEEVLCQLQRQEQA